jgi:outer membrane protein
MRLTLLQAENLALKQSPLIHEANDNALAAGQVVKETRSNFFPQITGTIDAVGTGNAIQNAFGGSHTAKNDIRIGASGDLNNPTILSRESNGLNITQLIFDFGRTAAETASAKYSALSESAQRDTVAQGVVMKLDQAYLTVLKSQSVLKVANQTVKDRQQLLNEITALMKNQLKSQLDVSVATANLEEAKQLVLQAANAEKIAEADLAAVMGLQENATFVLSDTSQKQLPDQPIETLISSALSSRPEAVALRNTALAAKKQVVAARDARLPKIQALGSLGVTPVGDPGVEGRYAAAGVDVELPLFTGGLLSSRQKEASFRAQAAGQELEEANVTIAAGVKSAWFNASTALKNIDVAEKIASNSDLAMVLAESRYQAGQDSIIELSQAQLAATQADMQAVAAKYDYQIAESELEYQLGTNIHGVSKPKQTDVKRMRFGWPAAR